VEGTQERVVEERKKAGVRFLPSGHDAMLAAAGLSRVIAVLGKIRSARPRFVAVLPVPAPLDYEYDPGWIVELETMSPTGARDCFDLMLEPIQLRLTRLERVPCKD
jgi:hypothetical protein